MAFLLSQAAGGSLTYKDAVRAASDSSVDINAAPASLGGVTLAFGNRVLLLGQADASQNGIYIFTAVGQPLVRSRDANSIKEFKPNMYVPVSEGAFAEYVFQLITDEADIVQLDGGLGASEFTFEAADFNEALANAWLATKTTSDLAEGSRLYFTVQRARDAAVIDDYMFDSQNQAMSQSSAKIYTNLKTDEAKTYADGLASALDLRLDVLEQDPVTKTYVDNADSALDLRLDALEQDPVTKTYVDNADSALQNSIDLKENKASVTRITKTANYVVAATDDYIGCDSATPATSFTLTLPDASTAYSGKRLIIKDEGGLCTSYNIIVNAVGGQAIDGSSSYTLNSNYESVTLICNGTDEWFII